MSSPAAAIFDLDRTLLLGSSATVFQRHLFEHGLGREPGAVGRAYGRIYQAIGESAILMQAARLGARVAKGWPVDVVDEAANEAADELSTMVLPWARLQIEAHREAGDKLVLATTSPDPWVSPLADRLGFDAVVATKWRSEDGHYTGETEGSFMWGRAKANGVKAWAARESINLRASTAYSDSHYDTPLLMAVGHPVAINPDPRLQTLALLKGWPTRQFDAPAGVVKFAGFELQQIMRPLGRPELMLNADFEIEGLENIPAKGGAIICANHRSYFDPAAMALLVSMSGRNGRYLGKKEVFDAPVIGWLAAAAGGIRVDRGTGSDEPLERAVEALAAGDIVVIMPEGTIPRGPAFFDPELKGRWGAARMAAAANVPVIPVGLWGTEKVWPRSARFPSISPINKPTIQVKVGKPVDMKHRSVKADTKRLMTDIAALLPPESRERIDPTPEQLAMTYPPGYSGDPAAEADRRPGTDT